MSGDLVPESAQVFQTVIGLIANDDCRVDGTNRDPSDPVRQIFRGGQCLVNSSLVAAKRAAALQNQANLFVISCGARRKPVQCFGHI